MRRVHARLRYLLLAGIALSSLFAGGCASSASDVDAKVKPGSGEIMNPGGKPKDDAQAAYASEMQKTGEAMNAQMQKDAAAMAAARSRSGGK